MSRPFLWVACWSGCWLLYLALAGSTDWAELLAGAISSLMATVAVVVSGDVEYLGRMKPAWWFLLIRRLPGRVLADTVRVVGAILSPSPIAGRLLWVPFDPGGDHSLSGSRRALVKAGASIAPNSYAVIMDRKQGRMLTHQLVATNEPPGHGDRQWPV